MRAENWLSWLSGPTPAFKAHDGQRPGVTSEEHRRVIDLERENRELRWANEMLKAAASFFARELDPRLPT